jgi:NitT/TauT family transport system substrate-binding protein
MKRLVSFAAALTISLNAITAAPAAPKKEFNIAWTIYVGWMPWPYAADNGIVKKWADKYGITINVRQINDYVESINQYTAGKFDGVTVTNMDALTIPAAGGVDTTAIIMGDYSNGNDGVVLKKGKTLTDIKGEKVNLVELSVSLYLLARGLSTVILQEMDI